MGCDVPAQLHWFVLGLLIQRVVKQKCGMGGVAQDFALWPFSLIVFASFWIWPTPVLNMTTWLRANNSNCRFPLAFDRGVFEDVVAAMSSCIQARSRWISGVL